MKQNQFVSSETAWCPGCGNHTILETLIGVLNELEAPMHQIVLVGGIGQAGVLPCDHTRGMRYLRDHRDRLDRLDRPDRPDNLVCGVRLGCCGHCGYCGHRSRCDGDDEPPSRRRSRRGQKQTCRPGGQ